MTVATSKLAELEARAGASFENKEAWLAERRTGVTATEIRDLYLGRITMRTLADRKLGRIPEVGDLSHIPVFGWGNEREPLIAAEVLLRYGLQPESRVFHAADNPRFLASPDGLGENFDGDLLISEIKTAEKNIAPGTEWYAAKGYYAQKVWQMRVTGARRCLYAVEYRVEVLGGFEPGPRRFWWIEWDDDAVKLADELERLAVKFLALMDQMASEEPAEIDEVLDTHALNYLRALDLERQAKALKAPAWAAMLAAGKSQTSALARVTFSPGESVTVPDEEAAIAAEPALFARLERARERWNAHVSKFTKTVAGKPRLTVTPIKQEKAR